MEQKCLRVSQIDAAKLDDEIQHFITSIVQETFKYLPPGFVGSVTQEINLLVNILVQYYSIFQNNSTFGQSLMSIKYANLTTRKKIYYVFMQNFNYFIAKLNGLRFANRIRHHLETLEVLGKLLGFINFSIFLRTGSKPLLVERFLGLEQVHLPNTMQRSLQSKYLARELLWNGFIEILIFVLPLINYHKVKRILWSKFPIKPKRQLQTIERKRSYTLSTLCAYCNDTPVMPHHMGCSHIFCYVCLKGNQVADPGYECPICGSSNNNPKCESVKMYEQSYMI